MQVDDLITHNLQLEERLFQVHQQLRDTEARLQHLQDSLQNAIEVVLNYPEKQSQIIQELQKALSDFQQIERSDLTSSSTLTSLKVAEKTVRQSEERFRRIFEDSPLGMGIVTLEGQFLMSNLRFCEIVGWSQEELREMTFWEITHPDDYEKEHTILKQAVEQHNNILSFEKRYITKCKSTIWVHLTIAIVQDDIHGSLQIGMIEDISDRKQVEEERKRAEKQLKSSLEEKEILLKEIHHRVKNNMQTVASLLSLQASYIEDPRILEPFTESQNRINAMALIHEHLYRSENLATVSFPHYVHRLTSELLKSYQANPTIELKLCICEVELEIDLAISCGLIINELVSNALKHAFLEGSSGEISIVFKVYKEQYYQLSVSDNGIGIPQQIDVNSADSLGLQLVRAFTKKLRGNFQIDRGNGSNLIVTFPQSR